MIYTVTFNPAIDYVMRTDRIIPGQTNRSQSEEYYFGGKGINVSVVLHRLGLESVALGFVAGFTGDAIEKGLTEEGVQTDFVRLPRGISRINVKIKAEKETELNAQGPLIDEDSLQKLTHKLALLGKGDTLVLAGSIPNTLPEDMYERVLQQLEGRQVRTVVDATGELLAKVLKFHPFLIKPNTHELGEIVGRPLKTDEDIAAAALELQEKGARNVLVSMAGDGAMLVTEDGQRFRIAALKGTVKNSVGAGDSMVAGFLAGYAQSGDYLHALHMGSAAGSATAFAEGLACKEDIFKLMKQYQ